MKRCQKCGEEKPLEDFHRLRTSADGRQPRCKACVLAYMREYHRRNAKRIKAKVRDWRAANPDRAREHDIRSGKRHNAKSKARRHAAKRAMWRFCEECGGLLDTEKFLSARFCSTDCQERNSWRRWKRENPEKAREAGRRYRTNNPDSIRRKDHRRRARMHSAWGEDVHPLIVLELHDGVCGICGGDVDPHSFELDHDIPLARGGLHNYENVQPAHPKCNRLKRDRLPEELGADELVVTLREAA